jgi:hypothetical protein
MSQGDPTLLSGLLPKLALPNFRLVEEVLMAEFAKPRVIGFNHVALEVGDIDEALAFYGRLFRQLPD